MVRARRPGKGGHGYRIFSGTCRVVVVVTAILGLAGVSGCGTTPKEGTPGDPALPESRLFEDEPNLSYSVSYKGIKDQDLSALLDRVSQLRAQEGQGAPSLGVLQSRMNNDQGVLLKTLHSVGYFGASVTGHLEPGLQKGGRGDARAVFVIDTGSLYPILAYDFVYTTPYSSTVGEPPLPHSAFELGLEKGAPARGDTILLYGGKIVSHLGESGYPVARMEDRTVIVDRATQTVSVTMRMKQGELSAFGALTITGLDSVKENYVRRLIGWEEGEVYDLKAVNRTSASLQGTGLFTIVNLHPAKPLEEGGIIPMALELVERDKYSVGGGVRWATDEGYGVRVFWENRNLFGNAEALRISSNYGQSLKNVLAALRLPNFRRLNQQLEFNLEAAEEDTDAYLERRIRTFAGIDRQISDNLNGSLGAVFLLLRDTAVNEKQEARLLGAPATLRWDFSDDLLDPKHGWRLNVQATPYLRLGDLSINDGRAGFIRVSTSGSVYLTPGQNQDFTWASRLATGSIGARSLDDLPRSLRFYTGGGGSVRGYKRQRAGRIDSNGQPIGGRSFVEVSSEIRYRFSDNIGLAAFVDGGNTYGTVAPGLADGLFWGVGLGVRYISRVGPIRLDVATPLDRRKNIDSPFQLYISLGQAF